MLAISPDWMEAFLAHWEVMGEGQAVFQTQTRSGRAFGRRTGWKVHHLIPSDWRRRYDILAEALTEIQAEFLASEADELTLDIHETLPSHTLYFAGLMPGLGFEMGSGEILLQAGEDFLSHVRLPDLPPGIREVRLEDARLSDYALLYARAHAARIHHRPSFFREQNWRETIVDAAAHDDLRRTWIGLEAEGQIVASCYGGCRPERWGEIMSVEELAVLPEFSGRGLGRYTLIRCLQELQRHYGAPGRVFQIGTWRHLGPRPIRMYLGLGFQVTQAKTYAAYRRNR